MSNQNARGKSGQADPKQAKTITSFFKSAAKPQPTTYSKVEQTHEQSKGDSHLSPMKQQLRSSSHLRDSSVTQQHQPQVATTPSKSPRKSTAKQPEEELKQATDPNDLSDDGEGQRRGLRTRKIKNYREMLEDEVTLKTIKDEEQEKKRMLGADEEIEDEELLYEGEIERASDDEEVLEEEDLEDEDEEEYGLKSKNAKSAKATEEPEVESSDEESGARRKGKAKEKAKRGKRKAKVESDEEINEEETVFIDNLPSDEFEIRRMLKEVKKHIKQLEKQFFEEEDSEKEEELKHLSNNIKHDEALQAFQQSMHMKQFWCIPLSVNVTGFNFDALHDQQEKLGGRLFDVITIDPPWQLSSANPTRGVAIAYDTLNDNQIMKIPFDKIQTDGFLFIWVINAKYRFALQMMEHFGYKLVDEISWVKQTVNGKIAKGHGYYLQHAKETCLVGVKGNVKDKAKFNIESDVIFSQRRGQSQKPEEIYDIAEALVPNGYYLEIFGRRNNLHNGWVTIGNEL